ncbi:MAG: PEP-CTERM sorting domain-containing protein [Proteobacteria bacterium]|nr:PEP-CTERM sorting domain-containing protein [Pseudomonadota bacterium]MBU1386643.1 PEP-CTERM sorting domain-containing protein [Pseudomonadota bacterium]MBU1543254.1 PEP-CTERM sorting domain-containing protein [Pseudomonadota bacterium]MBU2429890.1 PEP-CTERM sorting domain-containing protein [Pseudomonadota bacterium]MBU2481137.1 PEP-CTERM sorting domain-containing protein [Pseudomonadota bacterium]
MKKRLATLAVFCLILGIVASAEAALTLTDSTNGIVFDDNTGQYWINNLNMFTNQSYSDQLSSIDDFNGNVYGGFNTWHVADIGEITSLFGNTWQYIDEVVNAFVSNTTANINNIEYEAWAGRFAPGSDYLILSRSSTVNGVAIHPIDSTYAREWIGAWVTTNVVATPVPSTFWLLGSGLIGLVGIGRRKLK